MHRVPEFEIEEDEECEKQSISAMLEKEDNPNFNFVSKQIEVEDNEDVNTYFVGVSKFPDQAFNYHGMQKLSDDTPKKGGQKSLFRQATTIATMERLDSRGKKILIR